MSLTVELCKSPLLLLLHCIALLIQHFMGHYKNTPTGSITSCAGFNFPTRFPDFGSQLILLSSFFVYFFPEITKHTHSYLPPVDWSPPPSKLRCSDLALCPGNDPCAALLFSGFEWLCSGSTEGAAPGPAWSFFLSSRQWKQLSTNRFFPSFFVCMNRCFISFCVL